MNIWDEINVDVWKAMKEESFRLASMSATDAREELKQAAFEPIQREYSPEAIRNVAD